VGRDDLSVGTVFADRADLPVAICRGRKRNAPLSSFSAATFNLVEFSVPVFARVVVIAAGEFDEHARLIPHRPRIVTRWQQHDIVL
jgi:hypothetical protein